MLSFASLNRRLASGLLYALAVLFLGVAVVAVTVQPAHAVADGSDWGGAAVTPTDSAVTVAWNNTATTPAVDVVPRDSTQVIPHTGGKTFADTSAVVRNGAKKDFSNMTLSVSQTQGLVHQGVQVSFTGVAGGGPDGQSSQVDLMQCWGSASEAQPDPSHCQTGVGGVDGGNVSGSSVPDGDKSLVAGGGDPSPSSMNFVNVSGALGPKDFSSVTTNEFTNWYAPSSPSQTTSRSFELQTGAESPGLGCGSRTDQPSTNTCWLVAIPMNRNLYPSFLGPSDSRVAPSVWAERLQVKLQFADVAPTCGAGSRTLTFGSELLGDAMASWIPAVCATENVTLGFGTLGDPQARTQVTTGAGNFVFSSGPIDDTSAKTVYAPVAIGGLTIGVNASNSNSGQPVTGVKLNARLVAKLVSESYAQSIDNLGGPDFARKVPWANSQVYSLSHDPEFQALNPGVRFDDLLIQNDLVVTSTQTDGAALLWSYLLHDPDAKAFLDGCPDPASGDSVINPFYSTRSYVECSSQASTLEAAAKAKRDETVVPATFQDAPAVYPPTGAAFPQPGYYERDAKPVIDTDAQENLSLANIHPRETSFVSTGTDAFRGQEPQTSKWCSNFEDQTCVGAPGISGKYVSSSSPAIGSGVLGLTDTNTAARYLLPTAALCDDSGTHCVSADAASLTAAAKDFEKTSTPGVVTTDTTPDYEDGAYPLAMPVYAEIPTDGLSQSDAQTFAKVLTYLTTTGQTPGHTSGTLPPGYAPITPAMTAVAVATVLDLSQIRDAPVAAPTQDSASTPETAQEPPADPIVPDTSTVPDQSVTTDTAPAEQSSGQAVSNPTALAEVGKTGHTPTGFPQFGLAGGLGGALAAGIAAPLVGRKRKTTQL